MTGFNNDLVPDLLQQEHADHARAMKALSSCSSQSACSVPPCDKCGAVQTELGGIEYGPPRMFDGADGQWCRKLHVCVKCTAAPND